MDFWSSRRSIIFSSPSKAPPQMKRMLLRVHLDELLVGMLPASLGRHVGNGPLHDLQQSLLDTLAGYVPGDGGVLALPGDLVDLISIDDAVLRPLHVEVRGLEQPQQDVLHIVAHIAGLRQGGGVRNGEGHLQNPGQCLGEQRLAGTGGPQQQDVALLQLHILVPAEVDPFVVVVHRHGQGHLGLVLADDVLVQHVLDLAGRGQLIRQVLQCAGRGVLKPIVQNAHAQLDVLITDEQTGSLDHPVDLALMLAAEGAPQALLALVTHGITSVLEFGAYFLLVMILSMRPKSKASWAVIQWSRSEAALISSAVLPVLFARISFKFFLIRRNAPRRSPCLSPCPWYRRRADGS